MGVGPSAQLLARQGLAATSRATPSVRLAIDASPSVGYLEPMACHGHSRTDERHLALHRAAFENLAEQPELQARVLELLERWLGREDLRSSRRWLERWQEMLTSWSLAARKEHVLDQEHGQVLRQCSPLAPALTPRERWAVLKGIHERPDAERRAADP